MCVWVQQGSKILNKNKGRGWSWGLQIDFSCAEISLKCEYCYLDNHPIFLWLQQSLLGGWWRRWRRRQCWWFGAILSLEATEERFEDVATPRLFQGRPAHLACREQRHKHASWGNSSTQQNQCSQLWTNKKVCRASWLASYCISTNWVHLWSKLAKMNPH